MPSTSLYPSSKNSWVVVSIIVYLCPCLGTHMFQWVAQPQIFTTISLTSKQSTLPTLPETNQIVHQNSKGCSDDSFLSAARGLFSEENKLEHLYFLESPVYNHRYQEMTFFFFRTCISFQKCQTVWDIDPTWKTAVAQLISIFPRTAKPPINHYLGVPGSYQKVRIIGL